MNNSSLPVKIPYPDNFRVIQVLHGSYPGNFRVLPGSYRGNFRVLPGSYPGNFRVLPGYYANISGITWFLYPKHFR
jgi:hypothetical protein